MELKVQKNIHRGMYVEFNISGDEAHYNFWHSDSLYLYEPIYGVFVESFKKSVEKFNYYGPTLVTAPELSQLQQELENNKKEFESITSSDDLVYKIAQSKLGKNFLIELEGQSCDLQTQWKSVVSSLKEINETLVELIRKCIQEKRVLWVLGM